jgi:hypothetical protein
MIALPLRRFALLPVVLLSATFVLLAPRSSAVHAQGSADNVRIVDLAKMVLPLSAFGPDYASFEPVTDPGFLGPDDTLGTSITPISGYELAFVSPDFGNFDLSVVATAVVLLASTDQASTFITESAAQLQSDVVEGTLTTFPVANLTGATGFTLVDSSDPGFPFAETAVLFRENRLVGVSLVFRSDGVTDQTNATAAAQALNARIKDVLTSQVTDFAVPPAPDVNCDGSLDAIDASLLLQLGAGLVASLDCGVLGDANQDGRINAIDASLILQFSAGLIDQLPQT